MISTALKWALPIVGCIIPAASTFVAFCVCYLCDAHCNNQLTDTANDSCTNDSCTNDSCTNSDDTASDTYSHTSSDIDFFNNPKTANDNHLYFTAPTNDNPSLAQ